MSKELFQNLRDIAKIRNANLAETSPEMLVLLIEAANDGRIKFFNYKKNRPIGYVAWINVNKESAHAFRKRGAFPRFQHEWNEGGIMILFDVCFISGWGKLAAKYLVEFLTSQRCVLYKRRGPVRSFSKKEKFIRTHY